MRKISASVFTLGIIVSLVAFGIHFLSSKERILSFVIPHHDMVASAREAFLQELSQRVSPETIILISPDHFNEARASLITTDRTWTTKYGEIFPNIRIIQESGILIDDWAFNGEHGIGNVIGPLKRAFPKSTIIPILANRKATYHEMLSLVRTLNDLCLRCVLVASVDFSHVNSTRVAVLHDALTLRALHSADSIDLYKNADADSPEALVALVEWSRSHGAEKFTLFEHTNSGELTGTEEGEITSHIFGLYSTGVIY